MNRTLLYLAIAITFNFSIQAQTPGISIFDGSGNNFIEYIPGNLPIIISAPHGGTISSGILATRSCGTNEPDDNTAILVREIQDEIFEQTGGYAHVIINNLHRRKLDPNRSYQQATCSNNTDVNDTSRALYYWKAFHDFIDDASTVVNANWGKGLYLDLHGQSHTTPRIEIGYRITRNNINGSDTSLNTITGSSITNLVDDNITNISQSQLIRGNNSLGALFHRANYYPYSGSGSTSNTSAHYSYLDYPGCNRNDTFGYRATPSDYNFGGGSCDDMRPNNSNYFSGFFYNNERHGSANISVQTVDNNGTVTLVTAGGTIDGMMTEVNRRVRDVGSTLEPFAKDYANVVIDFIDIHYNDFSIFNYANSIYDVSDSDPLPVLTTGVTGGQYLSSPSGLIINQSTGNIDLSASMVGNYTVTYSVGPLKAGDQHRFYDTDFSVSITDNTLSNNEQDALTFRLFPNPTHSKLKFKSSIAIHKIELFNTLGQKLMATKFDEFQGVIDISQFSNGLYVAVFYNGDDEKLITRRIIKE